MEFLDYTGLTHYDERIKEYIDSIDTNEIQVKTLPAASTELNGLIVQYIGATTSDLINGYFYKCNGSTWSQVNVQPSNNTPVTSILDDTKSSINTTYSSNKITSLLSAKANVSSIPTSTQDLSNDSNFVSDASYVHTDNNFTTELKNKVEGSYTKPSAGIPKTDLASAVQTSLGKADTALQSFTETDPTVPAWAKEANKPSYTASEVGALADTTTHLSGDVPTTRKVNNKALSSDITLTASDVGALANTVTHLSGDIATSEKGAANGVATLGSDGKIPSTQLPSYVDDVLEYGNRINFPATGESGKIYVDTTTNLTYRWSGTTYVEISPSVALGETSSTAYAGDKGKALADKLAGIAAGAEVNVQADWNVTDTNSDAYIKNKPSVPSSFAPTNAERNTIVGIQKNGTDLTVDANRKVNVTVPTKVSDLTNDSGFTTNTGTITGITMNGASKGTSGVVDLGTVITSHQSLAGKQDKVIVDRFYIQTGSTTQSRIGHDTLINWLISTKKVIPSNVYSIVRFRTTWGYAGSDILRITAGGKNWEVQLAGCEFEFMGIASNYNTGEFTLKITAAPASSFSLTSGYTDGKNCSFLYRCNGSGYSPIWQVIPADAKFTDTNTWRGIQDNLTSTSATDSLSANQGKVLKGLIDDLSGVVGDANTLLEGV